MPIGSVQGLVVALLLVVPGGLGAAVRRNVFATQAPSPFAELLHSLAAALVALVCVEWTFMVFDRSHEGFGDYLLKPLVSQETLSLPLNWAAFGAFSLTALALPTLAAWIRRSPPFRWAFRVVSPHASGLDFILHEARPTSRRAEEIWATVNTTGGEALLGQLAWRATPPDPLEVVLHRVRDLNDPEEAEHEEGWMAWLPEESIQAIWIHIPTVDDP